MQDFNSQYASYKPLPNTSYGMSKLKEIIQICSEIRPIIIGMDDIERKDLS